VIPVAVPIAASTVVWGIAFRPDGPINGFLELIGIGSQPFLTSSVQAPYVIVVILSWIGVGYWMLFLVSGINDIPKHLYEAADIDGAGAFRRFWSITLPLLRRPLVFVIVANTVANYLVFAPSQILTQGGPNGSTRVIMYDIFVQAFKNGDQNLAAAEIVLSMFVLLALVAAQFRLLGEPES
jgi:multiple sugar transport system permease protein